MKFTFAPVVMAAAVSIANPVMAQEPVGYWEGMLSIGPTDLQIGISIERGDDGELRGTADSPDQGAFDIPLDNIDVADNSLRFDVPSIGASYEAEWSTSEEGWDGTFRQGGMELPLTLTAGERPERGDVAAPLPAEWTIPSDEQIARIIEERIAQRDGNGMVVGVINDTGVRIVTGGPEGQAAFDRATMFEIGSITKVFTALVLADMANEGLVSLDDPVAKYLPESASVPERGGKQITLRNLSQHDSGLPRLPSNMAPADSTNPYADYTEQDMLAFLSGHTLTRDIGSQYEYSNLGVGLLGYALARAAGMDFEELVRTRLLDELEMSDTAISLSDDQDARMAIAHDIYNRPTSRWDLPTFAGAGALRSSADDVVKLMQAALDPQSPIAAQVKLSLADQREAPGFRAGLGWMVVPAPAGEVIMHGGGTGGFRSHIALQPDTGRGVVVLTNSAVEPSAQDVAMHILLGAPLAETGPVPEAPQAVARDEIELSPAQLDRVSGTYQMSPGVEMTIARKGDQLLAAITGQGAFEIFPRAPLEFFWRAVNAEIIFEESDGTITGARFSQDGLNVAMEKVN